ncbi:hypothetical protein ABZS95_26875, partial [Streptomyces sp. NPDC005479]|uniref:hypothetical protein n=1 Tax=Streptomyces sp. NPDC005479 TaxID=3154879 RepID=UPI0033B27F7E
RSGGGSWRSLLNSAFRRNSAGIRLAANSGWFLINPFGVYLGRVELPVGNSCCGLLKAFQAFFEFPVGELGWCF